MDTAVIQTVLWLLFGLVGIAWIAASLILSYHWRSYSDHKDVHITRATWWYYGISIVIFIITALLIFIL